MHVWLVFKEDVAGPRDPRTVDWHKTDHELFMEHLSELNDDLFEDEPHLLIMHETSAQLDLYSIVDSGRAALGRPIFGRMQASLFARELGILA